MVLEVNEKGEVERAKLKVQPERMGLMSLLRKVQKREPLPKAILALNLDGAIYDAFWLNGDEAKPDEALMLVRKIVEFLAWENLSRKP